MSKKKDSGTERHIASDDLIRKNENFNEGSEKKWTPVMSDRPVPKPQGSGGGENKKKR